MQAVANQPSTVDRSPHGSRTLPPIEYAPRADAVRARLAERDLTALAVTDMNNVRWLTGFTGSSGVAVLLPDSLVLVTDGRYDGSRHG